MAAVTTLPPVSPIVAEVRPVPSAPANVEERRARLRKAIAEEFATNREVYARLALR